ncbi:CHAP domain-containing protein [Streptococcus dentasini]
MNKKLTTASLFAATAVLVGLAGQVAHAETYAVQNGDSFFSIAEQHGMDPYQLAADNGMTISSTILPGQTVEVAGVAAPAEAVAPATDAAAPAADQGSVASVDTAVNTYPVGQCTWGVKQLTGWAGDWWGNGGDWASSAANDGYTVGSAPQVGSIVCWTDGGYGHVAYVTDVSADGQIQVLESNYKDQQEIGNYRGWFDPNNSVTPGSVSYIYPNA